jgi:Sec-independent protein translocase protein TatA
MSPLPTTTIAASWLLPGVAGAGSVGLVLGTATTAAAQGSILEKLGVTAILAVLLSSLLVWMTKKLSTQLDTQTTATQAAAAAMSSVKDALEDMRLEMRGLREDNSLMQRQHAELLTGIAALNTSVVELSRRQQSQQDLVQKWHEKVDRAWRPEGEA